MSEEEEVAETPAVTEVSIDTPPLSITCKAPGEPLDKVIASALQLYRDVYTPSMAQPGPAMGFVTERDYDGGQAQSDV